MNDIIEQVEEALAGQPSPHDLANLKSTLSAYYSRACGELEEILKRKPSIWMMMRKDVASDKATDQVYGGCEDGIRETVIRLRLKRCDKLFSAISSLLRVHENETRNTY